MHTITSAWKEEQEDKQDSQNKGSGALFFFFFLNVHFITQGLHTPWKSLKIPEF